MKHHAWKFEKKTGKEIGNGEKWGVLRICRRVLLRFPLLTLEGKGMFDPGPGLNVW